MGVDATTPAEPQLGQVPEPQRTIGLIVAGQLVAVAVVLAVLVTSDALSEEATLVAMLVFLGFLLFSMIMIRRVSRRAD
jgi:hypothetical protein